MKKSEYFFRRFNHISFRLSFRGREWIRTTFKSFADHLPILPVTRLYEVINCAEIIRRDNDVITTHINPVVLSPERQLNLPINSGIGWE